MRRSASTSTPFYLYFPFNHIHAPNSCNASFCGATARGPVGDAVAEVDWAVGQMMAALRASGVADNTLTFLTSDNGAPLGNDGQGNLPLRGGKTMVWEGGYREPGIAHWPGTIAAASVSFELVATYDIHPTLLALAGVPPPTDRVIDGVDLSPLLRGEPSAKGHDCIMMYRAAAAVNASGELFAVRCGRHKVYWRTQLCPKSKPRCGVAPPLPFKPGKQDPPLIFDLVADPGENLPLDSSTDAYKAALKTIGAARDAHLATITPVPDQNGRGSDVRYAVCGAPDSPSTLPAWPNCTLTPANWRPAPVCASATCLAANPSFAKRCTAPPGSTAACNFSCATRTGHVRVRAS